MSSGQRHYISPHRLDEEFFSTMQRKLDQFLLQNPIFQELALPDAKRMSLVNAIEEEYLAGFLVTIIRESEEIIGIDPLLERKSILELAAEKIAKNVNAAASSIRLFDKKSLKMLSFGAYGLSDEERLESVPLHDSIAGQVVRENRSIAVPDILTNPLYKNKNIVIRRGFHSLLAVPFHLPVFVPTSSDILGALQIYYYEKNRRFDPLEIIHAEMLARRVSFVLAKKKILDLQELNNRKEKIVNKIFVKLSNREGIKLKDLFIQLIPEIGKFIQVLSCSLFTVSEDQQLIHLEAGYPLDLTYHELGHTFTAHHHPYFMAAIHGPASYKDTPFERLDPAYILINDPQQSTMTSPGMREFVEKQLIHSILIVPLKVDGVVRHLLLFYATEQKEYFTDEEIELLTFFGKEIMKASRLEFFGDVLHDFKNPAIAVAGFASRALKLLEAEQVEAIRDKLRSYLEVIVRETERIEDIALTMSGEERNVVLDLIEVAFNRYRINEEVVRSLSGLSIIVLPPVAEGHMDVNCPLMGLERVIDNLLNNATKAIPQHGGTIAMRLYRDDSMACVEITNTGEIPPEQIDQVRMAQVRGRGLNIVHRFIQTHHGKIEVRTEGGQTKITVKLPLHKQVGGEKKQ